MFGRLKIQQYDKYVITISYIKLSHIYLPTSRYPLTAMTKGTMFGHFESSKNKTTVREYVVMILRKNN